MKPSPSLTLPEMRENETGYITEVAGGPDFQSKLRAMGLYSGRHIVKRSPESSGGPVVVEVMGTRVALGRVMAAKISVKVKSRRILLAGNPNVGKSVVFSRLTGLEVVSSNYPGTTVEYMAGHTVLAGERFNVVDVPGAYSQAATNKAEEVAREILAGQDKALILNVVDATNLERNLYYTLELASLCTPMIVLLNKWDVARRRGVEIDAAALGRELKLRVVPFVATTGEGISELKAAMQDFNAERLPAPGCLPTDPDEKWKLIGRISAGCQKITHKHATLLDKLEDVTSRPGTGLPFAAAVMLALFWLIRFTGEGLLNNVLDPLFRNLWMPLVTAALAGLPDGGAIRALLLGATPAPMESFGLLTTGLYIPFVTVLPYIISFYAVLGVLEDIGYLPRLAVLLDSSMHRLGLHGYGTIPMMLGLGCKVPAILAARVLETPRERVIATALTLALAPCMPQTAMILSLLAPFHIKYTLAVFGAIAAAGIASSLVLSRLLKGETPELFLEIPPYQTPSWRMLGRKLYFRLKDFLREAVPMIIFGVLLVAVMDYAGLLAGLSGFFKPVVTGLLGLPPETVSVMVLGFLRKDVSIAMLAPFSLPPASIVVGSVFLSLYLPCMASCMVAVRELGLKDALRVIAVNLAAALLFASALRALTVIF
jgi:ferrous iron transport protein B